MTTLEVPGEIARVWMKTNRVVLSDRYDSWEVEERVPTSAINAQLCTSLMRHRKGYHAPVLDLDIPHLLIPSSSDKHSHLYLDVEIPWWKYKVLLRVLAWVGILEKGYVQASISRGHTAVRAPWFRKEKT